MMTPRARKALGWTGAAALLAAVFALYTQPAVMVMLADQLWACFR
jgi:type II secretory pathway component PulM